MGRKEAESEARLVADWLQAPVRNFYPGEDIRAWSLGGDGTQ